MQPFLQTISMSACCFATTDSTTTAFVQLPYLGNVSLLPFLWNNCRAKTSTFPSLHSTCFAVAKQRQALSHLYTALAEQLSRVSHLDKHFPICCAATAHAEQLSRISHLERCRSMGHSRCVRKRPCLPS